MYGLVIDVETMAYVFVDYPKKKKKKRIDYLISGQCFHFIPPENTRKPVFWYFQGV